MPVRVIDDKKNEELYPLDGEDPTMEYIWGQYRAWDVKAKQLDKVLVNWRRRMLIFIVAGTLASVLSHHFSEASFDVLGTITIGGDSDVLSISMLLGLLSGILLSIAAYAGSNILSKDLEESQITCKSTAEAFKSLAYLYALRVAPFHTSASVFERIETLISSSNEEVSAIIPDKRERRKGMLHPGFTIDQYVKERVKGNIFGYYLPSAEKNQRRVIIGRRLTLTLGILGAAFGVIAGSGTVWSSYFAVWVGFLSATAGAIASFISTNRFKLLVVSYQATARKLQMMMVRWNQLNRNDLHGIMDFVRRCEEIIAIESSAWMAEMIDKDETSGFIIPEPTPATYDPSPTFIDKGKATDQDGKARSEVIDEEFTKSDIAVDFDAIQAECDRMEDEELKRVEAKFPTPEVEDLPDSFQSSFERIQENLKNKMDDIVEARVK